MKIRKVLSNMKVVNLHYNSILLMEHPITENLETLEVTSLQKVEAAGFYRVKSIKSTLLYIQMVSYLKYTLQLMMFQ
jgi:hypothetical protein